MNDKNNQKISRRDFLKRSALTTAALSTTLASQKVYAKKGSGKKVIIIGFDGMDPRLTERMMDAGQLPNLAGLRDLGGYSVLGTSIPPQSPVAWANFINGAGPGNHGIFDFIHRHPEGQVSPFMSISETTPGEGYWYVDDHKLQLDFWPFNHKPPETLLLRQGVPFWDYLDEAGVSSTFYNLPSNYPPSPSKYGHHRCLSGMGTPDLFGTYGIYQHYSEDGPVRPKDDPGGGGRLSMLFFEGETDEATLIGPTNELLQKPVPTSIKFEVHRDLDANAAVIEIQDKIILLKPGQWSKWLKLDFEMSTPRFIPNKHYSGICRFYLQEVKPNFRLYVTPLNADPSDPEIQVTEPGDFIEKISEKLGLFYTTGFQEDHKALTNKIFSDEEYATQTQMVLDERMRLLKYATDNYDDGLLFFYFSSTDVQSHMFWWDSEDKHPTRSIEETKKYFEHIKDLYRKADSVTGDIVKRYGDDATIIIMSDHGFANFKRQFNLNTWLKDNGYLGSADANVFFRKKSRDVTVDWSKTRAYGFGINGLYINLKGRERDGIVQPGAEQEALLDELVAKLEAVKDTDGRRVIRKVYRASEAYSGSATEFAPDLIVGYSRDFRASWDTCLGDMSKEVLSDNDKAWAADHCGDASEVPGVVFSNRPITRADPSLIDLAPSVLKEFGLEIPATMEGKNIF